MPDIKTVRDLVLYLSTQPLDTPVLVSSDSEGNRQSSLADASVAMIAPEDVGGWSIETYPTQEELDDPANDFDPDEDAAPDGAVRVVVLWPVN